MTIKIYAHKLVITALLIFANHTAFAEYQSHSITLYRECGNMGMQCTNPEREKEMLRLFGGKRNGKQLCLPVSGRLTLDLCMNNHEDGEATGIYHLISYLRFNKANYYVVRLTQYETAAIVLIDTKTGQYQIFTNLPIISPDGHHAVITMHDLDIGYYTNSIDIFQVTENGFKQVKTFPVPADNARWTDNKTILFDEMSLNRKQTGYIRKPGSLKEINGRWSIQNTSSQVTP